MRRHRHNHDKDYQHYAGNIAWRYDFQVIEEEDGIYKLEKGVKTLLSEEAKQPCERWWRAWLKLSDQYGYSGIWKDRD
jgi:hypothetical protein